MNKGSAQAVTRVEHSQEAEAKRVMSVDPFGGVITDGNFNEKQQIIESGSITTFYKAIAQTGTLQSTSEWQAYKQVIDETSGTVITKTWADGNDLFDNIATDLSVLTYS